MWPLQQGGIALATVLASILNNALLLWCLKRQGFGLEYRGIAVSVLRCTAASLLAVLPVCLFYREWNAGITWMPGDLLPMAAAAALFSVLYFLICRISGGREGNEVLSIFKR
jgi:putative peptidoglycan lipid II flippase